MSKIFVRVKTFDKHSNPVYCSIFAEAGAWSDFDLSPKPVYTPVTSETLLDYYVDRIIMFAPGRISEGTNSARSYKYFHLLIGLSRISSFICMQFLKLQSCTNVLLSPPRL